MDSNQVLDAINEIASVSGKNDKQALVNKYMQDPLFAKVVFWALNPLINFGISKRPSPVTLAPNYTERGYFDESTWDLLNDLAERRLTGNVAIDTLAFEIAKCGEKSGDLLWRIVKKDLRAGFGDSTVNKAVKGFIPVFPYMRCTLAKDAGLDDWAWGVMNVFSQEKADGMFMNVDAEHSGIIRVSSRQGSEYDISKFGGFETEAQLRLTKGYEYHGEFEVYENGVLLPRQTGNGIINSICEGGELGPNQEARYKIWDMIPLSMVKPKGSYDVPYETRFREILLMLKATKGSLINIIPTRLVKTQAEAYEHAAELMKVGKEGTVIKRADLNWKDTGSSGHKLQVKIKLEFEVSLVVKEIVAGKEDTKNEGRAGSLRCETSDGLLVVDVTVKNEAMRDDVDANPEKWIDKVIDVIANDITLPSESNDKHSLFLPRMKEAAYRTDKSEADTLQHVFDSKEMAIFGESLVKKAA